MACVDRSVWTDERLDDLAARGESQFELLRGDIHELRDEMRAEMRDMRAEMHAGFTSIRRDMFHGAVALFGTLSAMIVAMFAHALS
jgi:hypothetical protein